MSRWARSPFAAVAILAAAVVLAACSRDPLAPIPPPPSIPPTTATVPIPDLSAIDLKPVPGRTTTTVLLQPGPATLNGAVTSPEGRIPGAVVRIERLVGDGVASVDVVTIEDGTWQLPGVLGGRYRVRAWRAPDLSLTKPEVFFLEGSQTKTLDLKVQKYTGVDVEEGIAPNPPILDQPAGLTIVVVERVVDDQGIVRSAPIARVPVELFGTGQWRVTTANPTITDGNGKARFELTCRAQGKQSLTAQVGDTESFTLELPGCELPPPTTTEPATTSTTDDDGTTSTTGNRLPTSSTTRSSTTTTTSR